MDEILFQVLAEGVGRYLDAVERLAGAQAPVVGTELRRLAAAWRAVLGMHQPAGSKRRCAQCRRRHSMCGVWRVANAYFVRRVRD